MGTDRLFMYLDDLAAAETGSSKDLWPDVRTRLEKQIQMTARKQRITRAAAAGVAVLALIIIGLVLTPQGRVLAGTVYRFFIRTDHLAPAVKPQPTRWIAPDLNQAGGDAGYSELSMNALSSLDELRSRVPFTVMAPAVVPAGYRFQGGFQEENHVVLQFAQEDDLGFILLIQSGPGGKALTLTAVSEEATVESLQVGENRAEFVSGVFIRKADETEFSWMEGEAVQQTLRWEANRRMFTLIGRGEGVSKEILLAFANSLTDQGKLVQVLPTPAPLSGVEEPFPLRLEEVEKTAGFAAVLPSELPDSYQLMGGAYQPEGKVVELWFSERPEEPVLRQGLTIRQVVLTEGEVNPLPRFVLGTYGVDQSPQVQGEITETRVGEWPAQYVVGTWQLEETGAKWLADPWMTRLRWQTDTRAFQLSTWGAKLELDDLLRIAASMDQGAE